MSNARNISKAESRFVNATGDTVTNTLNVTKSVGLIPQTSNEYTEHGTLSYYATDNNVYINGAEQGGLMLSANGDRHERILMTAGSSVNISTNNQIRLNIDNDGRVTKPYQVAFMAYKTGGDEFFGVGDTLKYNATLFNIGNAYNTSTYTFTAPIAGRYFFSITANGAKDQVSTGGVPRAYWKINGSSVAGGLHLRGTEVGTTSSLEHRSSTVIFQLSSGDTVNMVVGQNSWDIFSANHFSGYLLG